MATSTLQKIRDELETERLRIQSEITSYPPPIPACDAYFNFLLERRALISEEIARLDEVAASAASESALESFVRSSALLRAGAETPAIQQTPRSN